MEMHGVHGQGQAELRQRVKAAGLRITAARLRVLAVLDRAGVLLSHHDLEQALGPQVMDRVTLYRVLESLVGSGLAHRVAGSDRVWRFGLTVAHPPAEAGVAGRDAMVRPAHGAHAHFQCRDCGRIVCLGEVPVANGGVPAVADVALPEGYQPEAVELTVRGRCSRCAVTA